MENIVKTYPSGLRMIVRPMPGFKSVATAVHLSVGSRDENPREHGMSHFVEHLMFKGTETRTAEQISQTLSNLGVDYNAYTSDIATCYHTKGLITNLDDCCDVLSDMYFNIKIYPEDFRREAEVIVQEIKMHDDNPRHALSDLCSETFFAGTPFGHPIAGTPKSVRSFSPDDVRAYIKKHYTAPNTIIAFAGDITVDQAERMVKKYWLCKFKDKSKLNFRVFSGENLAPHAASAKRKKRIVQHNAAVMFPAVNAKHPDRYVLTYINEILSCGMSSRLFASVRDKMGLVYTISGGVRTTDIGGYYYIWFSCTPKNTAQVFQIIREQIEKFKTEGAAADEIQKVRNIKRSDRLFEVEDVERINQRSVTQLSAIGEIETAEQYLAVIDKITARDILAAAGRYLDWDRAAVCVVGPRFKG